MKTIGDRLRTEIVSEEELLIWFSKKKYLFALIDYVYRHNIKSKEILLNIKDVAEHNDSILFGRYLKIWHYAEVIYYIFTGKHTKRYFSETESDRNRIDDMLKDNI